VLDQHDVVVGDGVSVAKDGLAGSTIPVRVAGKGSRQEGAAVLPVPRAADPLARGALDKFGTALVRRAAPRIFVRGVGARDAREGGEAEHGDRMARRLRVRNGPSVDWARRRDRQDTAGSASSTLVRRVPGRFDASGRLDLPRLGSASGPWMIPVTRE
jgi:hypothetical protein